MKKSECMIGVDAGGTKTLVGVFTLDSNIIRQKRFGVGSYAVDKNALENIYNGLKEIHKDIMSSYDVIHLQLALSGIAAITELDLFIERIKTLFKGELSQNQISVVDDGVIALYSVLKMSKVPCIVISAGTGLVIYGFENGIKTMAAGWGHLLGERGSAFSTIHQLALSMIKHFEENKELNPLEAAFLEKCGCKSVYQLKRLFYSLNKGQIARFVTDIINWSNGIDTPLKIKKLAVELLEKQGEMLAEQVIDLTKRSPGLINCLIGFRGGFFTNNAHTIKALKKCLALQNFTFRFDETLTEPLDGCFYFAKQEGYI